MAGHVNMTAGNVAHQRLGSVAFLRAGYAFRSAIPGHPDGDVLVLQGRDIQGGMQPDWSNVVRTQLPRRPGHDEWLRSGDILFNFRGTRFFALMLDEVPPNVVASTQFMLLRVQEPNVLLPAFLAWQLNQPTAQQYFTEGAAGTAQRSLRRGVIEALDVAVPPTESQSYILDLVDLALREKSALEGLIRVRSDQVSAIAASLLGTVAR